MDDLIHAVANTPQPIRKLEHLGFAKPAGFVFEGVWAVLILLEKKSA